MKRWEKAYPLLAACWFMYLHCNWICRLQIIWRKWIPFKHSNINPWHNAISKYSKVPGHYGTGSDPTALIAFDPRAKDRAFQILGDLQQLVTKCLYPKVNRQSVALVETHYGTVPKPSKFSTQTKYAECCIIHYTPHVHAAPNSPGTCESIVPHQQIVNRFKPN